MPAKAGQGHLRELNSDAKRTETYESEALGQVFY